MENTGINVEHKDRLFSLIFGKEKNKKWTLALYNAVNHSNHSNPDDIEINTLDDSLYMGMKNDVSFILNCTINLYEHQSTYNPNMPVRQLIYLSQVYSKYIKKNKLYFYGSKRIMIPIPRLITFYNGTTDSEDETELFLSDLFPDCADIDNSDVSVRVHMLNINYGHNRELLGSCKPLYEYSWFVDRIRNYNKSMSIEKAVNSAIDEMPDSYSIKEFLIENRAEVEMSILTEYDEAEVMEMCKEAARKEGLEEGREEGRKEGIEKLTRHLMSEDPSLSEKEATERATKILG